MNAKMLLLCLFPTVASAQGFAGLGTEAEGFSAVTAPAELAFPEDHAAHPGYRIEWWYVTAALEGADGRDYGVQWTLFRQATRPGAEGTGWENRQIWMGHAGLTTEEAHFHGERFARGGIGVAGVDLGPFRAWIDDWALEAADDSYADLGVRARTERFGFDLRATTDRPLVLHGEDGFSVKSETGQASYYYSQPFYDIAGTIEVDGAEVAVTGTGWLDREWSSQPLDPDQDGWDWFSLHLDGGERVMAFRLRSRTGAPYHSGTWIDADGTATPLPPDAVTLTPIGTETVAGREVPVRWRVEIPSRGLVVDTAPVNAQSWMATLFPYWEGPVRVTGSHPGRGYLEMTGYE